MCWHNPNFVTLVPYFTAEVRPPKMVFNTIYATPLSLDHGNYSSRFDSTPLHDIITVVIS